jgi:hypothetical protein
MILDILAQPVAILVLLTSLFLLILRDWRFCLAALGIQYIGVLLLTALSWPIEIAVVKLVTGWMGAALLGVALINSASLNIRNEEDLPRSGVVFRIFAAALAGLVAYTWGGKLVVLIPEIEAAQAYGGLILILMGLLHLGLTDRPLRVILGLLTLLAGFEVLYAALEHAALVTGLLAAVNLGLAMVGAFLINAPMPGEQG